MQKRLWIIPLCFLFLPACHRQAHAVHSKMDAELRRQVNHEAALIHFTGECRTDITPELRRDLEKTGIRIKTVTGSLFTARGNYRQILKLAGLDRILRLEASPEYQFKSDAEVTQ